MICKVCEMSNVVSKIRYLQNHTLNKSVYVIDSEIADGSTDFINHKNVDNFILNYFPFYFRHFIWRVWRSCKSIHWLLSYCRAKIASDLVCHDWQVKNIPLGSAKTVHQRAKVTDQYHLGANLMRFLWHITYFGRKGGRGSALSRTFLQIIKNQH